MLLSDFTELFDPCGIALMAVAGFVFCWLWLMDVDSTKNLCSHAYNDGYHEGKNGNHTLPESIRTRYSFTIPHGSYRYYHGEFAVRAWKLGNDHGRDKRPMLTVDEIYKLAK